MHVARSLQIDGEFVAELPVEVGYAGDPLNQVPACRAARVDQAEDGALQGPVAVWDLRGHDLGPAHREGDILVGPGVGEQTGRGHDVSRPCVFHQGKVVPGDMRMASADHVGYPVPYERIGWGVFLRAKDVAVHGDKPVKVLRHRPAQTQPVSQIAPVCPVARRQISDSSSFHHGVTHVCHTPVAILKASFKLTNPSTRRARALYSGELGTSFPAG